MFREAAPARGLIISGICLPLALFLGYLLATPDDLASLFWLAVVLFLLALPFIILRHHALTIVCWNLPVIAFFLPGKQLAGVLMAGLSLLLSIASWTFRRKNKLFIPSPATTYPLLILGIVLLITMAATGGLHSNIFGSQQWGATRYVSIIGALVGYFAIIAHPVAPERAKLLTSLYFLSGTGWLLAIGFALVPNLNLLLAFFPTYVFQSNSLADLGMEIERFIGLSYGMQYLCLFMMMRYGIRGLCDWHRPWRALIFISAFGLGMYGGFRSLIVLFALLFLVQTYFEKLYRSSIFLGLLGIGFLSATLIFAFSDRLPLPIQRSISFIPGINLHPLAQQSAQDTYEWRLEIWKAVLPDVPHYLLLGKGYGFDSTDFYFAERASAIAAARGFRVNAQDNAFLVSGDYHNGPLTLIIPLGIWGILAFAGFCWGSIRTLHRNFRYGDPALTKINTFLLSYFVAKLAFYLIFFGSFYQDLLTFIGITGVSIAVNGVVTKSPEITSLQPQPKHLNSSFKSWNLGLAPRLPEV